ncbi:GTP 3',8-cyclase MoaA [Rathayibacter toxicus]|uniref:GTP 3',8-cyclase n=1 Tax=Rathayibacter toxicus TaxID=145458 RepID=A0A0C5B9R2_9MICO|nr:GTP 3',8-cyclase MoaA [Rathayibacter toxicus]AJM77548.1 molybdenum cofactor biosynthesis protein MoeA [Rathayibacter toxicus]ALS56530.1 cyclic pyranopterin phosphate synthase MoaA [Rathayibacter toxicus]KKM44629.1 molybdenum cofactor biosynthesis protein MoeA [Rathayibacter toxicus]PPG21644.1 GTP 3',8-cyclase MoaA [Rathayibacter toxicus]PPG46606.1 GTP 3',8-cyclase MoaA [Rathayibacter toxicus]
MSIALGIPGLRPQQRSADLPRERPVTAKLVDSYGRSADDLRISLTDKCNLRCTYCMPAEGLPFLPRASLLTRDEIVRLARIAVEQFEVRQIRFTGGEPLLRKDLAEIIRDVSVLEPRPNISLTTNAIGLAERAQALAASGLDRVNVSLDSLCPDTFAVVTRRPFLDRVLAGIDALAAAGFRQTKINTVLLRGINDREAPDLLAWALAGGHQLRFIEQMALDADHGWDRVTMITAADIRALLSERFVLSRHTAPRDGAPAELFDVRAVHEADGAVLGQVGIIASVTENFCGDCRRTRLTAEGRVRSCLFSNDETDLLGPMRLGASDHEVAQLWRAAMWAKPAGHEMNQVGFVQPERTMSAIGG